MQKTVSRRAYIAIDLKSFYASVECVERGLDPLTTNLVVANPSRTEKTICLAVSPPLKSYGVPGRPRLFEVIQRIREVNEERRRRAPGRQFRDKSWRNDELKADPSLAVSYLVAPPRMAHYMKWSTQIYQIYLRYVAPEDIHVYSIDEVFMDVTEYLGIYKVSPRELAKRIIRTVLKETGITATAGIGTNLYLCKVAMDIVAKHVEADKDGVRIAELDEQSYRELLWTHEPLTDFWRVGRGTVERLSNMGICTMKEIAHARESLLYKAFGIDAELLIDHAWGREPVTIADIKAYRPKNTSFSSGQVLPRDYEYEEGVLVVKEMADLLCLDLVDQGLVTSHISLVIGYSNQKCFEPAKGSTTLRSATSSNRRLLSYVEQLYRRIVRPGAYIRRITLTYTGVMTEDYQQFDLFSNPEETEKDVKAQRAAISIKQRYGRNAILKGMNLEESATTIERNGQIGGHKSGV